MKIYDNYNNLKENDFQLALELLEEKGIGGWQDEEIYFHKDLTDFAIYEVEHGWYSDILHSTEINFNGAPDLFDYIDYESLGEDLQNSWDNSCNYLSKDGYILSTSYGW